MHNSSTLEICDFGVVEHLFFVLVLIFGEATKKHLFTYPTSDAFHFLVFQKMKLHCFWFFLFDIFFFLFGLLTGWHWLFAFWLVWLDGSWTGHPK